MKEFLDRWKHRLEIVTSKDRDFLDLTKVNHRRLHCSESRPHCSDKLNDRRLPSHQACFLGSLWAQTSFLDRGFWRLPEIKNQEPPRQSRLGFFQKNQRGMWTHPKDHTRTAKKSNSEEERGRGRRIRVRGKSPGGRSRTWSRRRSDRRHPSDRKPSGVPSIPPPPPPPPHSPRETRPNKRRLFRFFNPDERARESISTWDPQTPSRINKPMGRPLYITCGPWRSVDLVQDLRPSRSAMVQVRIT